MSFAIPALPQLRSWLATQEVMRLAALVTIAVFLADWASKLWAAEIVASGATFDPLLLLPTHNTAFVFSAGTDQVGTLFVMAARFAALYGLAYVFSRKVVCDERSSAGLGCVLGGGIGNTADLAVDNAVFDFMNVGPYPLHIAGESFNVHFVFNAADVAILIGIALLAPRLQLCALQVQRQIAAWESTIRLDRMP
ncbi:MAG TPA: signal peptidase II [Longimicrobiales bacterium]